MGTFTNSEDPDEMPHNVAFHQGLHCLSISGKKGLQIKKYNMFKSYNMTSLDIYNGPSHIYCIIPVGRIH